jgi:hypothetical protein
MRLTHNGTVTLGDTGDTSTASNILTGIIRELL